MCQNTSCSLCRHKSSSMAPSPIWPHTLICNLCRKTGNSGFHTAVAVWPYAGAHSSLLHFHFYLKDTNKTFQSKNSRSCWWTTSTYEGVSNFLSHETRMIIRIPPQARLVTGLLKIHMRGKWDAKEGGNDAIFESDEEVDEAWRSRAGGAPMVGKVDGGEGVSTGLDLKTRDKSINADDARQAEEFGKGWTQPPGKVLTSEWEEAVRNNEWMEVEREERGSWGKRCFAYFCHLGMGFFASTTETRPVEHLFHMMRFQTAAIPKGADSLILALIEKRVFFLNSSLCGGVKWMMRAEEKRKTGRYWDTVAQVIYSK